LGLYSLASGIEGGATLPWLGAADATGGVTLSWLASDLKAVFSQIRAFGHSKIWFFSCPIFSSLLASAGWLGGSNSW
jgi:hypothetical protein